MMQYGNLRWVQIVLMMVMSLLFNNVVTAEPNREGIQTYQKNIHLSAERSNLAEDINRYHNADDLWEVLRHQFVLPHYEDSPAVQNQIEWFMNHQEFLLHSATRAAPYLYYILQQVKKRNLPPELVLLPIFESSFDPFAYSPAGAAGIWQMMPGTASGYGLKQDWWYDGRRDVIVSTKAALNYLSYLGTFFDGNWLLAVAAYDTGEGNVLSAIRRNIRDGITADFWSLPLAQETRDYVPRLLALAIIISNPEKYPVYLPPVRNAPYLAQMDVGAQIDLKQAAVLAGMSLKKLMLLNPGFNRAAMSPYGPYHIVLPIENVEAFSQNLASLPMTRQVSWQHYKVRHGDTLASLASRYNTSSAVIKELNKLHSNHLSVGSSLVLPRTVEALSKTILEAENHTPIMKKPSKTLHDRLLEQLPVATSTTSSEIMAADSIEGNYSIQPGDTIYMARQGDTIEHIANHFHVAKSALLASNPSTGSILQPGQKLVIPTHAGSTQMAKIDDNSPAYDVAPGDTIYTVRTGETMESIAQKFHTSPPAIRVANLLASNDVREGDRLLIPAPV